MRKAALLPFIVLVAVILGGSLYLFGGPAFHPRSGSAPYTSEPITSTAKNSVTVLGQGTSAPNFDQRVNYRITDVGQFMALWQMVYGNSGPTLPNIDFTKNEVLAVFDGSHTTGGYDVQVTNVEDAHDARSITITHTVPGERCVVLQAFTRPFVIVQVRASSLPVTHIDATQTTECP